MYINIIFSIFPLTNTSINY